MQGLFSNAGNRLVRLGVSSALVVTLVGCAGMTTEQKALACGGAVVGGALLGAHLAGGEGAAVGVALGSAACGVILHIADEKDQARIAAAQRQAALSNRSSKKSFTTQSGKKATVTTKVEQRPKPKKLSESLFSAVPASASSSEKPKQEYCRYVSQTVTVEGQSANLGGQMWCSTDGDFKPYKGGL